MQSSSSSSKRPEGAGGSPGRPTADAGHGSSAASSRRSRLALSVGAAAAGLALGLLTPSGGNGAEPPATGETGSEETTQTRGRPPADSSGSGAPIAAGPAARVCLAQATSVRPASRFECDIEISPDLLRLSVLYGADGWSGGRASSWQELRDRPLSIPRIESGLRESEGGLADWQDTEARMRLEGRSRGLRYRAEYGFFQDGFDERSSAAPSSLRSGGRFESAWSLGFLQPKLELSRFWEQDREPGADGEARSKARLAVDVPLPHLPLLTLSVGRESRAVTSAASRAVERETKDVLTDVASATLWYGRPRWEAYVTSSYFQVEQDLDNASEAVLHDHIVSWTYRTTDALSLVPLLEYTTTTYPRLDYAATSALASLGVYHASFGGSLNTYLYASYRADRDSLGYVDTRSADLAVGLKQDISRFLGLAHGRQILGLQFSVGRYDDLVYRDASTFTYGALLHLRILP
jgi:hypothetical protein